MFIILFNMFNKLVKNIFSLINDDLNINDNETIMNTNDTQGYNYITGINNDLGVLSLNNNFKSNYAVIYTRISSLNQKDGFSLALQKQKCKEYCLQNNFTILKIVEEIESAREMKKLNKLLKIIDIYTNINLVIYEPTRFSRNPKDYHNIISHLEHKHIVIHFPLRNLISNNNGDKKIISSLIIDGQIESETISRRIKNTIQFKKDNGTWISTNPKFGYKYCKIDKKQKINEHENKLCLLIHKMYFGSDTNSVNKLLTELTGNPGHKIYDMNDEECEIKEIKFGNQNIKDIRDFLNYIHLTRRGRPWTYSSVKTVLAN